MSELEKANLLRMSTRVTNKSGVDLFGTRTVRVDLENGMALVYGEKDPMVKKLAIGRPVELEATGVHADAFASKTTGRITTHIIVEGARITNIAESEAATLFKDMPDDGEEVAFVNIEERIAAREARTGAAGEGGAASPDLQALAGSLLKPKE